MRIERRVGVSGVNPFPLGLGRRLYPLPRKKWCLEMAYFDAFWRLIISLKDRMAVLDAFNLKKYIVWWEALLW